MILDVKSESEALQDLRDLNNLLIGNRVNKFYNFIDPFEETQDIKKYLGSWFYMMRKNIVKFLEKQEEIIKEVIEDSVIFENYNSGIGILMDYSDFISFLKDYQD